MGASGSLVTEAVGAAAAVCSTVSFLPQLIKLIREKAADAVSLRMYVLTVTGFALWTAYGLQLGSAPLIAANLISLTLSSAILALKLRYRHRPPGTAPPAGSGAARGPA